MKLFAFVRRARRPSPAPAAAPEDATSAAPVEKRRRRPSSSSSSSGAAAWKPTLGAISEDAALTAASAAATKAQAKPAAAAKAAKARSPRRTARAASYDDLRVTQSGHPAKAVLYMSSMAELNLHYGPPTVLPPFTPTVFLF